MITYRLLHIPTSEFIYCLIRKDGVEEYLLGTPNENSKIYGDYQLLEKNSKEEVKKVLTKIFKMKSLMSTLIAAQEDDWIINKNEFEIVEV